MKLATLCYVKAGGQTLMLHRIKRRNDMHAGKWNGLGGKLLPGESPEECVVREVYEESGLRLYEPDLRGVLTFPSFSDGEDWYTFVYVGRRFSGELIESEEGVLSWIDDDKLTSLPLWEGDPVFLRWLEQDRFFSGKFVYLGGKLTKYEVVFYTPLRGVQSGMSLIGAAPGDGQELSGSSTDDTVCWVCGGHTMKRNCKIICERCGFMRDCSDP